MKTSIVSQQDFSGVDLDQDEVIVSGDFWQDKQSGKIRLIRSLDVIDGNLHSVNVLHHPSDIGYFSDRNGALQGKRPAEQFSISDFLGQFKYIDQEYARRVRDQEREEIHEQISHESALLSIGYVEEETDLHAARMLTHASEQIQSDMRLPVKMAQTGEIDRVKERIADTKALAKKQEEFIEERQLAIARKTGEMSLYYTEKAEQGLAAVDGTLKFVAKLQDAVGTLNLFLGEGVNVVALTGNGAVDAPIGEPVTFYQRKLFLDEEFLYLLRDGGADHRSLGAFKEALEIDNELLTRIAPSPKSVVLMQFRRFSKHYVNVDSYFAAVEDNANRTMFLLVRNGENVHLIFSDSIDGGERLFPTAFEINGIYRDQDHGSKVFEGVEVDQHIDYWDTQNVNSRKRHDMKTLYYQRLLLILNGAHTRYPKMFGEVDSCGFGDWLGLQFQQQSFAFVHDDEDALGMRFEPAAQFIKRHNLRLQRGVSVIGDWGNIVDEDNAKGMWSQGGWNHDPRQIWTPITTHEPHVVEQDRKGLYIRVLCNHWYDDKEKYLRLYLDRKTDKYVVTNWITSEEVDFYLNSRAARVSYIDFAFLLISLKKYLKREEEISRPVVEALSEMVHSLWGDKLDQKAIASTLFDVMGEWRSAEKGADFPQQGEEEYEPFLDKIGKMFFARTFGDRSSEYVRWVEGNYPKDNLIRLSIDSKDRYYLYAEVPDEEKMVLGTHLNYPFVLKIQLKYGKRKGFTEVSRKEVLYREWFLGERVQHVWSPDKIEFKDKIAGDDYVAKREKLIENMQRARLMYAELCNTGSERRGSVDGFLRHHYEAYLEVIRKDKTRYVPPYKMGFPVEMNAVSQIPEDDSFYYAAMHTLEIIEQTTSIELLIAAYGSDALYEDMTMMVSKRYRSPRSTLADYAQVREGVERGSVSPFVIRRVSKSGQALPPIARVKDGIFINKKCMSSIPHHSSMFLSGKEGEVFSKEDRDAVMLEEMRAGFYPEHIRKRMEWLPIDSRGGIDIE